MAQQMSVKLSRSDASPWGFRLQGGKDFGSPLLIQKVNGGSPAERAGLQAGDAVIKVNNVEVFNMRHKEAQDQIVRAGNGFDITVQRGGSTWKPSVTPIGPSPVIPQGGGNITPVTKTSLAANKPAAAPIGTGHNYSPAPFAQQQMNGSAVDSVKSIVNKQYNTPVGIYSEETIAETLSAQAEVLAGGVLGVNFKKNERNYDPKNSEVFKMLNEIANEPRTPEPDVAAGLQYFSHVSHAIGGRATSPLPGSPQAERMGTPPGQRMVTFPSHRFATLPAQKTGGGGGGAKFPPPMRTQPQPVMKALPQSAVKPLPQSNVKPLPKTMGGPPAPKVVNDNPQCNNCERVIVGVFVRIKDKNLHVECFKCATCGTSLKNVGYYNINNKLYCDVHAKLVARQHPPAPNLEPVTIPPGAQKPAGAISAALASRAPAVAPSSPQPSNFAPMPFHSVSLTMELPAEVVTDNGVTAVVQTFPRLELSNGEGETVLPPPVDMPKTEEEPINQLQGISKPFKAPRGGPTHVQSPRPVQAPGGFTGVKPSFNAVAPSFNAVAPPPMRQPTTPTAPGPAPAPASFTTPAKPAPAWHRRRWRFPKAPVSRSDEETQRRFETRQHDESSGKCFWPPKISPEEEFTSQPTATPLYIPPGPINQSAPIISMFDQSSANPTPEHQSSVQSESAVQQCASPQVQPFPQPYSDYITHQPVARPMSAYRYSPKPLGTTVARPRSAFAEPNKASRPVPNVQAVAPTYNVTFDQDVQLQQSEMVMSTSFEETSTSTHHKKFSVCSQEVSGITARQELSPSIEQLSESIDTAILVSKLTGRPESPVPMEHVQDILPFNEEPITETQQQTTSTTSEQQQDAKTTIETRSESTHVQQQVIQSKRSSINQLPSSAPQGWQSPLVCALTTAPERPYSPLPSTPSVAKGEAPKTVSPRPTTLPVSYRQLPQPAEGFIPIAREPESETVMESTDLVSALTIAPERPYSPLPAPPPPLPIKPVPMPEQTEPYHTSREQACHSPMVSALTIAPQRPYSPLTVTQAPTSHVDTIESTQSNIEFKEPFNLPTPSAYTSMLAALTIASDRPYSPLCVTQAPTLATEVHPVETQPQIQATTLPPKIVGNVQPSVYKPAPAPPAEIKQALLPEPPLIEELKQAVEAAPPAKVPLVKVTETQAKPVKEAPKKSKQPQLPKTQKAAEKTTVKQQKSVQVESQKTSKTETVTQQSTNALSLHRQTQQRPITPKVPRSTTPSIISGLSKPATIPYYQQNIGDGDFPCRSPRPATPSLICPMTVPRTPTPSGRAITPIPHKQLDVVRSLTPVQRVSSKQTTQSQQMAVAESQQQKVTQSTTSTQQGPQVVVTRRTQVKEEFETFHKESTKIIERSGTTSKCISQSEQSSKMAQQSGLRSKEVTGITDGVVTQRKMDSVQSGHLAAQSQQFTYDSQTGGQMTTQTQQCSYESQSGGPIATKSQQQSYESQCNSLNVAQTQQLIHESQQQSITAAQVQPTSFQAPPQNTLEANSISKDNFMTLEESQRASPLPFPNISLPEGMTYEVVDNKALYTSGKNKQMYKLNQPYQMMAQKEPIPQFQPPSFKAPSIQKMTPKFEPSYVPVAPTAPAQPTQFPPPSRQVKFQPVAPQPPPVVSKPIQAPTATLPVHVMSSSQHANTFQPTMSQGVNSFTPKSSGNGFQNFSPQVVASPSASCPAPEVPPRRVSGAFQAPSPNVCQGFTPRRASQGLARDVFPKNVAPAPGLMDPCTSPPNAGGGSAPKGGSVAGTSAPVRGRGVLNQPGARQAMCASCHAQIRGPFVTALGKTWCPNHFVCGNAQCKRELADIGFVEEKGQLYCEYCFEQFIAPGCNKCSKKIKGDCLNAIGKHFHPECFSCSYCNKQFGNNPFFLEDGMPYCQADWNELFTTKCFACGFPIEAGDRWVEALNNNYHSQCFNCTSCKKNLEGQSFFAKSGRPFCKAHAR